MNIGELFIALGFDVDDQKLKNFKEEVKGGLEGLLKMSAAAAGAVYAVNAFVEGSVRSATALRNFNIQTGLAQDSLQKWQIAGTMSNTAMSVEQVTASVQGLQQAIADISMGKGPSGPLAMLGIDSRGKDAFTVLEEMRKNFKDNVSRWGLPQTVDLMKQAGVDPGLINSIKLTRTEFDKLYEGKLTSQANLDRLVKLGTAIENFKINFSKFKNDLSADWSPTLIRLLDKGVPLLKQFANGLKETAENFNAVWKELEPFKWFILVGAGLLFAELNPISAVILSILYILNEWGKYLRGLPSAIDDVAAAFTRLHDSIILLFKDPMAFINQTLDKLEGLYNMLHGKGYTIDHEARGMVMQYANAPTNDIEKYMYRAFERNNMNDERMAQMSATNQNNFNNVYHIQTVEDAFAVGAQIAKHQQDQINYSYDSLNNGPRY